MILLAGSEGPDQTARMRSLIWALAVRIYPKTRFRMASPFYILYIAQTLLSIISIQTPLLIF